MRVRWIAGVIVFAAQLSAQPVAFERIANAANEPQNWLTYWGNYGAQRYRKLNQINTSNAKDLRLEWMFQTGQTGAFETTPFGWKASSTLQPRTATRMWRFWTIPAKEEPGGDTWLADSWKRGGGATWLTGTYNPKLNLVYWGVGNPGPDLFGDVRKGDNLYTASVVPLDGDTGKLKWHFQFSPHDTHDWDAAEALMLLDLKWEGRDRKLVVQANRNGFFHLLDRETGEYLHGAQFARQNWAKEMDAKGRPITMPNTEPSTEGAHVCPGLAGAANWMAPSFNPETGWFYFPVREQCDVYFAEPPVFVQGKAYWSSMFRGQTEEKEWGLLKALDPLTGETKWDFRYYRAPWGTLAILATQTADRPSFILFRNPNLLVARHYVNVLHPALPILEQELRSGCVAVLRHNRLRVRKLPFSE